MKLKILAQNTVCFKLNEAMAEVLDVAAATLGYRLSNWQVKDAARLTLAFPDMKMGDAIDAVTKDECQYCEEEFQWAVACYQRDSSLTIVEWLELITQDKWSVRVVDGYYMRTTDAEGRLVSTMHPNHLINLLRKAIREHRLDPTHKTWEQALGNDKETKRLLDRFEELIFEDALEPEHRDELTDLWNVWRVESLETESGEPTSGGVDTVQS